MSQKSGDGLPLVAFRLPPDTEGERSYDEFALAHQLRVRSWVVPAYTMAPKTENFKMLRVVVREDFTRSRCESLITDVKLCMQLLDKMDKDAVKRQQDFINKHHLHSGKATHNHPKYKVRFDTCGYKPSFPSTILCTHPPFPTAHCNFRLNSLRARRDCLLETKSSGWRSSRLQKPIPWPSLAFHRIWRSRLLVKSTVYENSTNDMGITLPSRG